MITNLYIWRGVVALGYPCLESFLSTESLADECLICVDPTSGDDTMKLAKAIRRKFPKTTIVEYVWPESSPDGSAIGTASQFALEQVYEGYVINVQADEVYPEPLVAHLKAELPRLMGAGFDGVRLKVLNLEHNAQRFQGGEQWDGVKSGDVWERGGLHDPVSGLGGAGYNKSMKIAKVSPKIRFSHDAWTFEGGEAWKHIDFSDEWPIIHLHDFARDHLLAVRRMAADRWWTDQRRFGHYKASADTLEATASEWMKDEKWLQTTSPFDELLPGVVKPCLGQTTYKVNWEMFE